MNTINLIIALASGLLGSIIGGIIASCGAIRAVTRMECMRQSERLKILLRSVISELNSIEGHPAISIAMTHSMIIMLLLNTLR